VAVDRRPSRLTCAHADRRFPFSRSRWSGVITAPSHSITDRWTTFCSSRMFCAS
jgi:hypothetical protein